MLESALRNFGKMQNPTAALPLCRRWRENRLAGASAPVMGFVGDRLRECPKLHTSQSRDNE